MDFFQVGGPTRDETDKTHRRSNALIHGWGKYPWMRIIHECITYVPKPKILSTRQSIALWYLQEFLILLYFSLYRKQKALPALHVI